MGRSDEVIKNSRTPGLDGLVVVVVVVDGTLSIALGLSRKGLPIIGVPKTIDNTNVSMKHDERF